MVKIVNGNLLDCKEDIIAHQVNTQGTMGGGVARQLALKYPKLEKEYNNFCDDNDFDYENLKGSVFAVNDDKIIANIFSQKENFDTDYETMKQCLKIIKDKATESGLSVAIPCKIGCGIANGKWDIVFEIIKSVFENSRLQCTIYKLKV